MISRIGQYPLTGEVARFLLTGGLNTALTIMLYQLLVTFLNPAWSYAIAWIAGFIFVAVAYPKFVFRSTSNSYKHAVVLLLSYLFSFLIGLVLTWLFGHWGMNKRLSIFVVIAITSAMNFIAGKYLYGNRPENASA